MALLARLTKNTLAAGLCAALLGLPSPPGALAKDGEETPPPADQGAAPPAQPKPSAKERLQDLGLFNASSPVDLQRNVSLIFDKESLRDPGRQEAARGFINDMRSVLNEANGKPGASIPSSNLRTIIDGMQAAVPQLTQSPPSPPLRQTILQNGPIAHPPPAQGNMLDLLAGQIRLPQPPGSGPGGPAFSPAALMAGLTNLAGSLGYTGANPGAGDGKGAGPLQNVLALGSPPPEGIQPMQVGKLVTYTSANNAHGNGENGQTYFDNSGGHGPESGLTPLLAAIGMIGAPASNSSIQSLWPSLLSPGAPGQVPRPGGAPGTAGNGASPSAFGSAVRAVLPSMDFLLGNPAAQALAVTANLLLPNLPRTQTPASAYAEADGQRNTASARFLQDLLNAQRAALKGLADGDPKAAGFQRDIRSMEGLLRSLADGGSFPDLLRALKRDNPQFYATLTGLLADSARVQEAENVIALRLQDPAIKEKADSAEARLGAEMAKASAAVQRYLAGQISLENLRKALGPKLAGELPEDGLGQARAAILAAARTGRALKPEELQALIRSIDGLKTSGFMNGRFYYDLLYSFDKDSPGPYRMALEQYLGAPLRNLQTARDLLEKWKDKSALTEQERTFLAVVLGNNWQEAYFSPESRAGLRGRIDVIENFLKAVPPDNNSSGQHAAFRPQFTAAFRAAGHTVFDPADFPSPRTAAAPSVPPDFSRRLDQVLLFAQAVADNDNAAMARHAAGLPADLVQAIKDTPPTFDPSGQPRILIPYFSLNLFSPAERNQDGNPKWRAFLEQMDQAMRGQPLQAVQTWVQQQAAAPGQPQSVPPPNLAALGPYLALYNQDLKLQTAAALLTFQEKRKDELLQGLGLGAELQARRAAQTALERDLRRAAGGSAPLAQALEPSAVRLFSANAFATRFAQANLQALLSSGTPLTPAQLGLPENVLSVAKAAGPGGAEGYTLVVDLGEGRTQTRFQSWDGSTVRIVFAKGADQQLALTLTGVSDPTLSKGLAASLGPGGKIQHGQYSLTKNEAGTLTLDPGQWFKIGEGVFFKGGGTLTIDPSTLALHPFSGEVTYEERSGSGLESETWEGGKLTEGLFRGPGPAEARRFLYEEFRGFDPNTGETRTLFARTQNGRRIEASLPVVDKETGRVLPGQYYSYLLPGGGLAHNPVLIVQGPGLAEYRGGVYALLLEGKRKELGADVTLRVEAVSPDREKALLFGKDGKLILVLTLEPGRTRENDAELRLAAGDLRRGRTVPNLDALVSARLKTLTSYDPATDTTIDAVAGTRRSQFLAVDRMLDNDRTRRVLDIYYVTTGLAPDPADPLKGMRSIELVRYGFKNGQPDFSAPLTRVPVEFTPGFDLRPPRNVSAETKPLYEMAQLWRDREARKEDTFANQLRDLRDSSLKVVGVGGKLVSGVVEVLAGSFAKVGGEAIAGIGDLTWSPGMSNSGRSLSLTGSEIFQNSAYVTWSDALRPGISQQRQEALLAGAGLGVGSDGLLTASTPWGADYLAKWQASHPGVPPTPKNVTGMPMGIAGHLNAGYEYALTYPEGDPRRIALQGISTVGHASNVAAETLLFGEALKPLHAGLGWAGKSSEGLNPWLRIPAQTGVLGAKGTLSVGEFVALRAPFVQGLATEFNRDWERDPTTAVLKLTGTIGGLTLGGAIARTRPGQMDPETASLVRTPLGRAQLLGKIALNETLTVGGATALAQSLMSSGVPEETAAVVSLLGIGGAQKIASLQAPLDPQQRAEAAQRLLRRTLTDSQAEAVEAAHRVGRGEKGKGDAPAAVGNYTFGQIRQKAAILADAGFSFPEIRQLMEGHVVGEMPAAQPGSGPSGAGSPIHEAAGELFLRGQEILANLERTGQGESGTAKSLRAFLEKHADLTPESLNGMTLQQYAGIYSDFFNSMGIRSMGMRMDRLVSAEASGRVLSSGGSNFKKPIGDLTPSELAAFLRGPTNTEIVKLFNEGGIQHALEFEGSPADRAAVTRALNLAYVDGALGDLRSAGLPDSHPVVAFLAGQRQALLDGKDVGTWRQNLYHEVMPKPGAAEGAQLDAALGILRSGRVTEGTGGSGGGDRGAWVQMGTLTTGLSGDTTYGIRFKGVNPETADQFSKGVTQYNWWLLRNNSLSFESAGQVEVVAKTAGDLKKLSDRLVADGSIKPEDVTAGPDGRVYGIRINGRDINFITLAEYQSGAIFLSKPLSTGDWMRMASPSSPGAGPGPAKPLSTTPRVDVQPLGPGAGQLQVRGIDSRLQYASEFEGGAEGRVFRVTEGGQNFVLKVAKNGIDLSGEVGNAGRAGGPLPGVRRAYAFDPQTQSFREVPLDAARKGARVDALLGDYVEGVPVEHALAGGQLTRAELQTLADRLDAALAAKGLYFWDAKPANVLLRQGESGLELVIVDRGGVASRPLDPAYAEGAMRTLVERIVEAAGAPAAGASPLSRAAADFNRFLSQGPGAATPAEQRAKLFEILKANGIDPNSSTGRALRDQLIPGPDRPGVDPWLQANRASIERFSREYGADPDAMSALLARFKTEHPESVQALGNKPPYEAIEPQLMQLLRRTQIDALVAQYPPETPQGRFMRNLGDSILQGSGKSIEEIRRAGAFAYVDFNAGMVEKISTGRNPDSQTSQVVFYMKMQDGQLKIDVYRQNQVTGFQDPALVGWMTTWLSSGRRAGAPL